MKVRNRFAAATTITLILGAGGLAIASNVGADRQLPAMDDSEPHNSAPEMLEKTDSQTADDPSTRDIAETKTVLGDAARAVVDDEVEPVPYEELFVAALQDAPQQYRVDMDEMFRLIDAYEDRFVLADEFDANGLSQWWATAWTGSWDDGSSAVCIGTMLSVSCISDEAWEPIAPVTVHRIGGSIAELVLIAEPGVTVTDIRIGDRSLGVHQIGLQVPSGRSAVALPLPESGAIAVYYTAADGEEGSYFIEYSPVDESDIVDREMLLARPYAPDESAYIELEQQLSEATISND